MYYNAFFTTREEAEHFKKNNGCGAIYSNVKGSRTKKSYEAEASMRGLSEQERKTHPYCVAWNG